MTGEPGPPLALMADIRITADHREGVAADLERPPRLEAR